MNSPGISLAGKQAKPKHIYTIPVNRLTAEIAAVISISNSIFRTVEGKIIKKTPNKASSIEVNISSFLNAK